MKKKEKKNSETPRNTKKKQKQANQTAKMATTTTTTPNNNFSNDAYTWSNLSGWKSYRTLRPFRGIYHDIRRRLPYYLSDLTDGLNYRTLAGTIRIFFVNLLPAIAFTLDMQRRTDHFYGINEGLFASALAAAVFSVFAAQPLTVVGVTGLISLFNYTTYDICQRQGIGELYPEFMAWVAIWAAVTHWITAVCNWCDYMRYITDFSTNSFGMYVSIIYMSEYFCPFFLFFFSFFPFFFSFFFLL